MTPPLVTIRGRRTRGQRGAAAPFVAILITVVVLTAALVVDLGMQRVARSDMQSLADVVALDLSRELDGSRTVAELELVEQSLANKSRDRNQAVIGFPSKVPDLEVSWGEMAGGDFRPLSGTAVPSAVRVVADTAAVFAFTGVTGIAEGNATRDAVATADKSACFRLGSFVASLDSSQSALLNPILSGLLGGNVHLTAIGYQGLAAADVSLLELVEVGGLGVGTVEELLALDNVSVGDLFVAAARVLDRQGKETEADLLRSIVVTAATPTIAIADLIEAGPSDQAALGASLNVLDLVTNAAFVATGDHGISLENEIRLPGVVTTKADLTIIESPRTRCGRVGTTNSTAQIKLDIGLHIPAQQLAVPLLGTSLTVDETDLTVSFDVGSAVAELKDVECPSGEPDNLVVDLRSSLVGSLQVSGSLGVHGRIDPLGGSALLGSILSLLSLNSLLKPPYLTLDALLNLDAGFPPVPGYNKLGLDVPIPEGYTTPTGSGTGDLLPTISLTADPTTDLVLHYWDGLLALGRWKRVNVTSGVGDVFHGVIGPLVDELLGDLLNPVVAALQDTVVKPLADLLGVQLAGADVFAVPTPTCGMPRLVE